MQKPDSRKAQRTFREFLVVAFGETRHVSTGHLRRTCQQSRPVLMPAPQAVPLVAPVEVAGAAPETRVELGVVDVVVGRPGERSRDGVRGHVAVLHAVHRLLEARLLFGLEQRMVLEWILGLVAPERHGRLEVRVPALQLEVILDDLCEQGGSLYRHRGLRRRWGWLGGGFKPMWITDSRLA